MKKFMAEVEAAFSRLPKRTSAQNPEAYIGGGQSSLLKKWSARIDNWAHSDTLSGIYARIHEDSPAEVYETFRKWNVSKNPWLRRLSIVSLFYYSSQRKGI